MNREILFKAKRTDNGEWVEGYYVKYQPCASRPEYVHGIVPTYASALYMIKIDPDTLCQYTGLTDKNGRKIWENDIIKTSQYGVDNGDGRNFAGFDIFSISFSECSFCLMNKWRRFNLRPNRDIEAIGNIFDNSDLLEE